jgi:hypothetical protein
MIKFNISTNFIKTINRHKKLIANFSNLNKNGFITPFLQKQQNNYLSQAKEIVLTEVYNAYSPKKYERTWNFFKSISIQPTDKKSFSIFINPSSELEAVKKGSIKYYPRFIPFGIPDFISEL